MHDDTLSKGPTSIVGPTERRGRPEPASTSPSGRPRNRRSRPHPPSPPHLRSPFYILKEKGNKIICQFCGSGEEWKAARLQSTSPAPFVTAHSSELLLLRRLPTSSRQSYVLASVGSLLVCSKVTSFAPVMVCPFFKNTATLVFEWWDHFFSSWKLGSLDVFFSWLLCVFCFANWWSGWMRRSKLPVL